MINTLVIVVLFGMILLLTGVATALGARAASLSRRKEMFHTLWGEAKHESLEMLTDRAVARSRTTKVISGQQQEIWTLRARQTELLREVSDLKKENNMLIRAINKKMTEAKTPPPPSPNLGTHI